MKKRSLSASLLKRNKKKNKKKDTPPPPPQKKKPCMNNMGLKATLKNFQQPLR
jgi:hypothetical protein